MAPLDAPTSPVVMDQFGCQHYKRKCRLVAPCCGKVYTCRFCHNEEEEHELDRKKVSEVVCLSCERRQVVAGSCLGCGVIFGKYFCAECRLMDDEDKGQYHCVGCGICRVGGREKFFHCNKCDVCLPRNLENKHKCVEKASRTDCPVCMDDIHTSRDPSQVPLCGHMVHTKCFNALIEAGHYHCPLCAGPLFK